ncbi:hypothetical protein PsAD2_03028 [Pseudovibrio axinellae]|uniref:Uncharacterized protein n=1 Tax=Pseudovibrio axinellae TaxID=989403 RepID=A0A165XGT0_9HYPH|nr:hypothetical protein [Pseudovibrio axinellae]KZL17691.1 hypothetical protein PsAD2_03028 [Pseudovibrio axinellae]SER43445.1 hypothetical protein SAMN05421798_11053 [Pseudovibrio axinellae]
MKKYRCLKPFWFDGTLRKKDEVITSTPFATDADRRAGNLVEEKEPAAKKNSSVRQSVSKDKTDVDK